MLRNHPERLFLPVCEECLNLHSLIAESFVKTELLRLVVYSAWKEVAEKDTGAAIAGLFLAEFVQQGRNAGARQITH